MKFLFVVVVVGWMSQAASFRTGPPSAMNWNAGSGVYPNVDIDFEDESSDEKKLKLDRHNSAPIIYHSRSRVVYAHHTLQADPLEDTSDENYDIGEHAPGPPMHQTPDVYINDNLESKEEDEMSNEESKGPQFISAQVPSHLDTSSPEYLPPRVVYSPPIPMLSAYMNPKPIPVFTAGSFFEYPVSSINNVINKPISNPRSHTFTYNKPAPVPFAYNPPTPSPIVFSGPNSNAAIYNKPPTAQVVYKYALPSSAVNKEEESFPQQREQIYYYEEDNKPDPIIYDSSKYSIAIDSQSKFAPYMYTDLISPSNSFSDSFSSQPLHKFTSFNHITPGFAKPVKDNSFLNLYAKPKQNSIEPFLISSLTDSIPKMYGNPSLISNVYTDSKDNSKTYKDLKDSNDFDNIEYDDVDHDILDVIPVTYNDPKSQQSIENLKEIQEKPKSTISIIRSKESEDFDDIEYEDVDHDILDSIPAVYSEPKSQQSNNVHKDIQAKNKFTTYNISYGIDFKGEPMEDTVSKLYVVKTGTSTSTPKPIIPATIVKNHIPNRNINYDTTMAASRMTKIPQTTLNWGKTTSSLTNGLSRFSSRTIPQRSPNYSRRMASLRASLRESHRQRYRARSSEENTRNIYSLRNRLRYTTRGSPYNNMRRSKGIFYNRQSSENDSSEERIPTRRHTLWGRGRQYRPDQSSEEYDDDDIKIFRTRVSSRLNTRKLPVRTTTVKPTTTTVKTKRTLSRGRSILNNRNRHRSPARQSLQCFLMSIVRANYNC